MIDEASVPPPSGGFQLLGEAYAFEAVDAEGNPVTVFEETLELTFQYDPDPVALKELVEEDLKVYHYNGSAWIPLPSSVDTFNHTVTGYTDHFSPFAPGGTLIPEPGTCVLVGLGLFGLIAFARRSLKKNK